MLWTYIETDRLRQLVSEGHTAAVMAEAMGITRSAILGRLRRMGISIGKNKDRSKPPSPPPKPELVFYRTYVAEKKPRPRVRLKADQGVFKKQTKEEAPHQCLIHDLNGSTCRWPLWGSKAHSVSRRYYCGNHAAPGKAYCSNHASIAYYRPHSSLEPSPVLTAISTPANSP